MLVDIFNEPWSIFAHTEEISLLLGRLHLTAAVGTFSIHQLGRGPEGLAGSTIKALISALVDIALIIKLFKNLLNLSLVILICGADKLVIGGILPDRYGRAWTEDRGEGRCCRRYASGVCRPLRRRDPPDLGSDEYLL